MNSQPEQSAETQQKEIVIKAMVYNLQHWSLFQSYYSENRAYVNNLK